MTNQPIDTSEVEADAAESFAQAEDSQKHAERFEADAASLGRQLSTWVVLANGGALLMCLNGLLQNQICDWPTFQPLVTLFAVGLGTSFAAGILDYLTFQAIGRSSRDLSVHSKSLGKLGTRTAALARDTNSANPNSPVSAELQKRLAQLTGDTASLKKEVNASKTKVESRLRSLRWITRFYSLAMAASVSVFAWGLIQAVSNPKYAAAVCGYEVGAAPQVIPEPQRE